MGIREISWSDWWGDLVPKDSCSRDGRESPSSWHHGLEAAAMFQTRSEVAGRMLPRDPLIHPFDSWDRYRHEAVWVFALLMLHTTPGGLKHCVFSVEHINAPVYPVERVPHFLYLSVQI